MEERGYRLGLRSLMGLGITLGNSWRQMTHAR